METPDTDFVALHEQRRKPLDLVELVYDNAHARRCKDYRPSVSPFGIVYCDSCGVTVETINDVSDSFCPSCDCPKTSHKFEGNDCLECGSKGCRR